VDSIRAGKVAGLMVVKLPQRAQEFKRLGRQVADPGRLARILALVAPGIVIFGFEWNRLRRGLRAG